VAFTAYLADSFEETLYQFGRKEIDYGMGYEVSMKHVLKHHSRDFERNYMMKRIYRAHGKVCIANMLGVFNHRTHIQLIV
jgi:hypothetical protein